MAKTATKQLDRQRRQKARRREAVARQEQRDQEQSREIYEYGYTISRIATDGSVWVLQRGEVLATGQTRDGSEAIKVWHNEGHANLSSRYDHPNHQPCAVPLDEWLTHWTPHLASQGVRVAVNPYPRHPATTSTADGFAADLREGLQRWGPDGRDEPKPTLPGRWVNSQDLEPGDILINRNGDPEMVTAVRLEYVSALPVFNLTIDEDHTFAVGKTGILVHNAPCRRDGQFRGDSGEEVESVKTQAQLNREANLAKGVPENQLGPSGKPKIHTVDHPTRKRAKDAARADGKRKPILHPNDTDQPPHFHPVDELGDKIGKQSPHHNFPKSQK